VKQNEIYLRKQINSAKDDPTYKAFLNGDVVGTIGRGWSRVGGNGWIVVRKDEASSLTKKTLADCVAYIADRIAKQEAK
jgi:hypothetical protein